MVGIDWRAFSDGPDYVIWILNDSLYNKEGQKMKNRNMNLLYGSCMIITVIQDR